jgi:hypothetical protein
MPTPTYDLIASTVLTVATVDVEISSIPSTYRDLILVVECSMSSAGSDSAKLRFGAFADYFSVVAEGNGTSATSNEFSNQSSMPLNYNYSAITNTEKTLYVCQFLDYSATNKHKTALVRVNRAGAGVSMTAGRWSSTSAINTITFGLSSSLAVGSTFYLYGIAA